jgi:hypothetical protein
MTKGGPRGLIRLGLPLRSGERFARLLNFVAVEPVTKDGRRGYSELETSPSRWQARSALLASIRRADRKRACCV